MNRWDFYTGLIFLLLAGAVATTILHAPVVQEIVGPGPYFFPAISAILIGGLSLTLLLRSVRQPVAARAREAGRRQKNGASDFLDRPLVLHLCRIPRTTRIYSFHRPDSFRSSGLFHLEGLGVQYRRRDYDSRSNLFSL